MTDLNKEREAFEVAYSEGRKIFPSTLKKYADGTYYNGDVRAAWKWWQAGKAQAVPESYCLVPKEPNDEIIASMKLTWWESDCAHTMKTSVAKSIYAGIVKASESGAEE